MNHQQAAQYTAIFQKNLFFLICLSLFFPLSSCLSSHPLEHLPKKYLSLPTGEKLTTYIAKSPKELQKGLSGIRDHQLKNNEALFFYYDKTEYRSFWMPNTYFDLDLFFLNENLVITHIVRKLTHYPSTDYSKKVPRTPMIKSRHVLEIKAKSELAQSLKKNMQLKWTKK